MPGLFIDVQVEPAVATNPELAQKLADACPVDIFEARDTGLRIVEQNLDECVLCDLCLAAVPEGGVRVLKLYE